MVIAVLRGAQADLLSPVDGVRDRLLVAAADTGDLRWSSTTLHRHILEDESSLVLEGRRGLVCNGETVEAVAGDLVWESRNAWHTLRDAGDSPVRILEASRPVGGTRCSGHSTSLTPS